MAAQSQEEQDEISAGQLGKIINRKINTIRMWERTGKLPKHLHPRRDERGWRWWTHSQVYGSRGIIAWMKRNDLRPGKYLTDPSKENEHIEHLRRPKFLNKRIIKLARTLVKNEATMEEIIEELYQHTKYSNPSNFERALRYHFDEQGWFLPDLVEPLPRRTPKAKHLTDRSKKNG